VRGRLFNKHDSGFFGAPTPRLTFDKQPRCARLSDAINCNWWRADVGDNWGWGGVYEVRVMQKREGGGASFKKVTTSPGSGDDSNALGISGYYYYDVRTDTLEE